MRLLVVDDDLDILKSLRSGLRSEGFAVDTASDGEEALLSALANDYNVIVMDYGLPKKDGLSVCCDFRKEGKTVPIIILSVRSEIEDKTTLLDAGADDYLTKPFSLRELISRIKALSRRPRQIIQDDLNVGGLVLSEDKRSVKIGKKTIYLTSKEFAILKCLAKNRGRIVSREKIMEMVWGDDGNLLSNSVEAHIANLRRKMDNGQGKKFILNFPGRGYKIGNK